ncbi:MAG TPA: aminotransferase class I/II-fold pyridoxal phosphate-dependent enzyme [Pirellulales bacterium]|nr:aminotransferase class I/II-fold pyridoxal phosphate-dependent enzyme [Pirellulales bacterium]
MAKRIDDICPRPDCIPELPGEPLAPPIHLSSVYRCQTPEEAAALLAGDLPGYAYRRDGHPNADLLAEKCRELHAAERAVVTSSGMAALALALVSQTTVGDHLIVSNRLYGRSHGLLVDEATARGLTSSVVDTSHLSAIEEAITPRTRLIVVETITNPLLRVANLSALVELAREHNLLLVVDNSLAGPALCRPLELGVDLVVESLTKSMSGHGDVLLGLLAGGERVWQRVPQALSTWGWTAAAFDCWLAARGLETLALRVERTSAGALEVARYLATGPAAIEVVHYPGLPNHADHDLAIRQFGGRFGSLVTFTLSGGLPAAIEFIAAAKGIPFCPSFGENSTTLSHPASTSHRVLSPEARHSLGISDGTIRLSVGIESSDTILDRLAEALARAR